jgi:hypothetical protein
VWPEPPLAKAARTPGVAFRRRSVLPRRAAAAVIATASIAIPVRDRAAIVPCENSDCRVASHPPGPAIATVVAATNRDLSLRHQSPRYLVRRRPGIVIADFDDAADRHALAGPRDCPAGGTFLAVLWSGNGGYPARHRRLWRPHHQLYYLSHPAVIGDRGNQTGGDFSVATDRQIVFLRQTLVGRR